MKGNAPSKITKRTQPGTAEVCSHQLNNFFEDIQFKRSVKTSFILEGLFTSMYQSVWQNVFLSNFAIPVAAYRCPGPLLQIQHGGRLIQVQEAVAPAPPPRHHPQAAGVRHSEAVLPWAHARKNLPPEVFDLARLAQVQDFHVGDGSAPQVRAPGNDHLQKWCSALITRLVRRLVSFSREVSHRKRVWREIVHASGLLKKGPLIGGMFLSLIRRAGKPLHRKRGR